MISAMSSSKHQPILGKRPNSDVAPEFPSPTGFSFPAAKEFAEKSQAALMSVQQDLRLVGATFPGNSFVFLPLITANSIQRPIQRGEDNSVYVVITKSYPLLKNEVEGFNVQNHCGIYVKGPPGVGKSYLLYLLASEYRLSRQKYRVTYINNCNSWRLSPHHYLLVELVTTFYDDTIEGKSVVQWCQTVSESDKGKNMLMRMMKALIHYITLNDLQWLVICDQHNALFEDSVVQKKFPFILLDTLVDNRSSNIKVVISASVNNQGYPTERRGWLTLDIFSHRFDDDEFKMWCDYYQLNHTGKVNHASEEAVDALFWTGGVPYELRLLWKQPRVTLLEKTELYRKNRVSEMVQSHDRFCDTLQVENKRNLKEYVSRMVLALPPPEIKIALDQELYDITPDTMSHGMFILTALNPVARDALLTYYGQEFLTTLGMVVEIVLGGSYTSDTKERIIKNYMIAMMEASRRFSFQSTKATSTGLSTIYSGLTKVDIRRIVHFGGNNLPMRNSFDRELTTLFIPTSANYPGLDFFIWIPVDDVLMAFQVNIKKPFTSHSKINGASDNSKLWIDFCFGGLAQKPMKVYWITPSSCVRSLRSFEDPVIPFEELCHCFPAIQNLNFF